MGRKTWLFRSVVGLAAIAASGAAMADGASTRVTILPSSASVVAQPAIPQAPASIPPLSASALLDAKTQVLAGLKRPPTPVTKTTDPIITLGVRSTTASAGSIRGNVTYLPYVVFPEIASFQTQGWINFSYWGLTTGNLYLLDCSVSHANSVQVAVSGTRGGSTVSAAADTSGHIIWGFAAPSSDISVGLQNARGPDNKPADAWDWSSCALHPVN